MFVTTDASRTTPGADTTASVHFRAVKSPDPGRERQCAGSATVIDRKSRCAVRAHPKLQPAELFARLLGGPSGAAYHQSTEQSIRTHTVRSAALRASEDAPLGYPDGRTSAGAARRNGG